MGEWRRLFYYLLLNVLVSAVTTLAVLIVWDKMQLSISDFSAVLPAAEATADGATPAAVTLLPTIVVTSESQTSAIPDMQTSTPAVSQATLPASPVSSAPQAGSEAPVIIENVIGAGDLSTEKIFIKRISGEGPLSLANWRLRGARGQEYTFPQISLYNPGAVYIHTIGGADTPRDLYWGRTEAAWSSGTEVTLVDDQEKIQATYKIP